MGIIRVEIVSKVIEARVTISEIASQKTRGLCLEPISKGSIQRQRREPAHETHRVSEKCLAPRPREGGGIDDRGQPC